MSLASPVTIQAHQQPLSEVLAKLRDLAQINMAINWNCAGAGGPLPRDACVDLDLKELPLEQVIKTLVEVVPTPLGNATERVNYTVGDNTLTLTTNAELGKRNVLRLIDVPHAVSYSLEPALTPATRDQNGRVLEQVLRSQLERSGEPLEATNGSGGGHALNIKEAALARPLAARARRAGPGWRCLTPR